VSHVPPGEPPIAVVWRRYAAWLREFVPAAYANLAPGATDAELAAVARVVGHELPDDARALLRLANGQRTTTLSSTRGGPSAFPHTNLLSTGCVAAEWSRWAETADDYGFQGLGRSVAPEAVRPLYASRHWVPLLGAEARADYLGADFDPGPAGVPGQIVNFGRDEEIHYVAAASLTELLSRLTEDVMAAGPPEPPPRDPGLDAFDHPHAEEPEENPWAGGLHAFMHVFRRHHPDDRWTRTPVTFDEWRDADLDLRTVLGRAAADGRAVLVEITEEGRARRLPLGMVTALRTDPGTALLVRDRFHVLVVDVGASLRSRAFAERLLGAGRDVLPALVALAPDGAVLGVVSDRELAPFGEVDPRGAAVVGRWAAGHH
jgi:cell wall assembly regulator SMI1